MLDDYHLVDDSAISDDMSFLLDHRPPQLHLVIGTRADPALPLARLRARGELVEVRAKDLRFTADEAASYLNGVHGLDLSASRRLVPRVPDRGMDRRPAAGGRLASRPRRQDRLHLRVRRR